MKVCVLQPDYVTTDVDYRNYDPPRDLSLLLPDDEVKHVFLNKLTTYKQLKDLSMENFDIYVNLCEGYLDWSVPSIDVIHSLDRLNLPYTGPHAILYDPTKVMMKYVAYCAGIKTPDFIEFDQQKELAAQLKSIDFPLFVKPAKAGDSLGVDPLSLVNNNFELDSKIKSLQAEGYHDILIEEYISGREFTVLVAANPGPDQGCTVFKPVEYIFPSSYKFKTYALKTSEIHTDVNVPCDDEELERRLRSAAEKIFNTFSGKGYARLDFRLNEDQQLYFLEINFTCSVFYEQGYEGSADYILRYDPVGKSGFLSHIIAEGLARHKAKQQKYRLKGNAIMGYGIFANQMILQGDVIFKIEESAQRIVTKRFVQTHWTSEQQKDFRHYAYPISEEVYILWDQDPEKWAPQNHSCEPNTVYDGLNLIALQTIHEEEELTLDYAMLLDDSIEAFECHCGSKNCRKLVSGILGNSISKREKKL